MHDGVDVPDLTCLLPLISTMLLVQLPCCFFYHCAVDQHATMLLTQKATMMTICAMLLILLY